MQDNRKPTVEEQNRANRTPNAQMLPRPDASPIPGFAITDVSVVDLNTLMDGLAELPFKRANPVVMKIQTQINQYNAMLAAEAQKAAEAQTEH